MRAAISLVNNCLQVVYPHLVVVVVSFISRIVPLNISKEVATILRQETS